jgi:antirestriction protein ArdC
MLDYRRLIERIVTAIETHQRLPWRRSWGGITWPVNLLTRKPYRGGNALLMMANAMDYGATHNIPVYMGFKQMKEWAAKNGYVDERGNPTLNLVKGSSPTWIKLISPYIPKYERENAEREGREARSATYAKAVQVYCIGQMQDSRTGKMLSLDNCFDANSLELYHVPPDEMQIANMIARWDVPTVLNGQNRAFYVPSYHLIYMPSVEQFGDWNHYYAVLFHEFGHSTVKALGRVINTDKGSPEYWYEELVAELCSIHLLQLCGIEVDESLFSESGNYVKGYLELLKAEPKLLYDAAAEAEKAAAYITRHNTHEEEETAPAEALEAEGA